MTVTQPFTMKPEDLGDLIAAYTRLRQIQMERIALLLAQLVDEETQIGTNGRGFDIHWSTGGGLLCTREAWQRHPEAWLCRLLEIVSFKLGKDPHVDQRQIGAEQAVEQLIIKAGGMPGDAEVDAGLEHIRRTSRPLGSIVKPPAQVKS